jgi:hypothetical protein
MTPTDSWMTALRIQLRPHRDYFRSAHFRKSDYLDQYGSRLRSFLDEMVSRP